MPRHSLPFLVILLLLAVAGGIIWQKKDPEPSPAGRAASILAPDVLPSEPAPDTSVAAMPSAPATAMPPPSATSPSPDPARYRRAYLLGLDGGRLSLENTEDVEGDFAQRRVTSEEWPGMLRCRLLSTDGKVLAEELVPAPDHLCTVLDAYDGVAKPVSYTVPGPVLFQLRLPRLPLATRLDVARITGQGSLARDQPVGTLSLLTP